MKNEFQKLVDRELSGLCWDERMRQKVLHALEKEEIPVKRKMTVGMAVALILVLVGSLALATGMMFSSQYDAMKLADDAMLETYGITDELLPFFWRELTEENGIITFTYRGMEDLQSVTGDYRVTIEKGKATAKWSLDDVEGGWNAEKLAEINAICKQQDGYGEAIALAKADIEKYQLPAAENVDEMPSEEKIIARMQQCEKDAAVAMQAARLTADEMDQTGRAALKERFGLTDQQIARLELVEESCDWYVQDEQKLFSLYYWLGQSEEGWTESDGIYIVDVNVETGAVEKIVYDTGLLGNG